MSAGAGEIIAAAAFLTRIPGLPAASHPGAAAFALVGASMGLVAILALPLHPVSPSLAAGVVIAALAVLDGALHLDGVADSADALAAPSPTVRERARQDAAVGAAGAVAVVLVLLLQAAALAAIAAEGFVAAVVIAGATSRSVPVIGGALAPAGPSGLGGWWSGAVRARDAVTCVIVVVALLLLPGAHPLSLVTGFALGLGTLAFLAHAGGGLSGDAYGAAVELGFLGALVGSAL